LSYAIFAEAQGRPATRHATAASSQQQQKQQHQQPPVFTRLHKHQPGTSASKQTSMQAIKPGVSETESLQLVRAETRLLLQQK
jgi:hypothetical protein